MHVMRQALVTMDACLSPLALTRIFHFSKNPPLGVRSSVPLGLVSHLCLGKVHRILPIMYLKFGPSQGKLAAGDRWDQNYLSGAFKVSEDISRNQLLSDVRLNISHHFPI